jgi:hypothetical protein
MTNNQTNSLNMASTTTAFLDKNVSIFTTYTKVTTLITAIKASIAVINQTATTQGLITTGATTNKRLLHKVAADKAEHVANGLQAYYEDINDATNAEQFQYNKNNFYKVKTVEIINTMQLIRDRAASILPAPATLLAFNITAADITELQTAITNFTNAAPTKKVLQAATTAATELLNPLFTTLRTQLRKLDNLIKTFKIAQPTFVEGYFNARTIVNLGKSHSSKELELEPYHFEAIFGKKFKEGDTLTIRNHSQVPIQIFLTDTPSILPTYNGITIQAQDEAKVSISKDFNKQFAHWLTVFNPNKVDDADVTIILAHGKSQSKAKPISNTAP